MATTMEQRAKFRELRLTGTSREDAMKQAYGSVAPTPPTPTGGATIPTQQFPSQPLNQQTTTGVNGETFQVAPVNQQGVTPQVPTQQPTTPTATTTPTQTPPTTTTPVDKTAEIKAQNEAQMALNKQKSDLAIQERKKAAEDAKLAATPTDQKSILTSLISGVSVPEQKTQAYRNAQLQYKNYQKFNAMTPQQLLDNMKMGEIDTATSQLLANNPSYIKAKQDFDKFQKNQSINQIIKSVASGVTGKTETVDYAQQASDSLARKLGIDQTNAEAYATIVSQNPEVVQLTKTVSSITKQLNTLNTERNAVYADLKSQYPDLSASAIMTLMASRTKQVTDQIDALNSSLTLTSADLKTAMELAKGEYEATKEDIALQAGIAKEGRDLQNSFALAKAQNALQQSNASFQTIGDKVYKVQNGQMIDTGIKAEKDAQYQSYGGKLYKIKGDSVTEVPGISTEKTVTPEWKQDAGGNWYNVNANISPASQALLAKYPNDAGLKNNNPAGLTWGISEGLKQKFISAGINFSQGTPRPANEGGSYISFATPEEGLKAYQIALTTGGSDDIYSRLKQWVGTSNGDAYANQIMTSSGLTKGQKFSELSQDQMNTLLTNQIKRESPGFYSLMTGGGQPSGIPSTQYNDQNIADLAYLVELQEKNPTQASKDMKELGYTARDIANYKAGNVPLTDKQKVTSQGVIDDIKDLVTNYDWNDATGVHFGMPVIAGTDRADTLQKIDQLVAKMTLPNLGSLKGPMSDKDLAFITKASSNLSAELSDAQFEKNLIQAYNVAARRAGLPEVTTLDEIKGNTPVKQKVGGEKAYSKYE